MYQISPCFVCIFNYMSTSCVTICLTYLHCQVKNVFFSTWFHVGILLQDIRKNLWCFHVKWYYLTMKYMYLPHMWSGLYVRGQNKNQIIRWIVYTVGLNCKPQLEKKKKVIKKSIEIHLRYMWPRETNHFLSIFSIKSDTIINHSHVNR